MVFIIINDIGNSYLLRELKRVQVVWNYVRVIEHRQEAHIIAQSDMIDCIIAPLA